ncbi:hypothetical protein PputUW4_02802 [Pseudomonas sp. UW4]|nr:hypothetical protein PputUW4_02802 [Pseudomonas sp. UW4]
MSGGQNWRFRIGTTGTWEVSFIFDDRPCCRGRNDQLSSFRIHNHRRHRRWRFFPWRRGRAGWVLFGHRLWFARRYHRVVDVWIGGFCREWIGHGSSLQWHMA